MRLLLEELLVEDGGCDTKAINIYARTIARLVHVQADINKNAQGDADFVRQLVDDLRSFSDKVPSTMPGGVMFGDGYSPAQVRHGHASPAYGDDDDHLLST